MPFRHVDATCREEEDDDTIVSTVIERLVDHYNQDAYTDDVTSVHAAPRIIEILDDDDDENNSCHDDRQEALLGDTPMIRYLTECLLNGTNKPHIFVQLLQAYPSQIRPAWMDSQCRMQARGVPVLRHYELVLRRYLEHLPGFLETWRYSSTDDENLSDPSSITSVLELLLSDCTLVTAVNTSSSGESSKEKTLKDRALKQNVLNSLWGLGQFSFPRRRRQGQDRVMRRCVCSLLAFGDGSPLLDLKHVDALLSASLFNLSKYCLYPPTDQDNKIQSMINQAAQDPMDWTKFAMDGSFWIDNVDTENVWTCILQQVIPDSCNQFSADKTKEIQRAVIAHFGWVDMATALQAHFFGRDMVTSLAVVEAAPRTRLLMGHRVQYSPAQEQEQREKDLSDNRPYQLIPSRLFAVFYFLSLLQPGDVASSSSQEFVNQFVPICYELLNANDDATIGKGAVVLFRLLNVLGGSGDGQDNAVTDCMATTRTLLLQSGPADNLLTALDTVIMICRDGCTLALVGLAQRELYRLLVTPNSTYQIKRRKATQQWFLTLNRNRHNPPEPKLAWGMLVTITSLLFDQALLENADCLELGRLGLTTLLPLIRLDYEFEISTHAAQVPILAVVALSNLLVAAHPVMPHHANKIICELLACLWHVISTDKIDIVEKKEDDRGPGKALIQHVLAMSLVICGKAADLCVDRILQAEYDDGLQSYLRQAQETAALMSR